MHDFDLHQPTTLQEAQSLLDQHGEEARIIAGGTGLVQLMKLRLSQPEHLVALHRVPGLAGIERNNGALRIGAMTAHREVEISPLVREHVPLLAEAYRRVSTVRIRNMATVGGGLAHGDPNQDPQPALIVLGASAVLASKRGTREVAVEELSTGYYETVIQPDEVLTEVVVPVPSPKTGYAFIKFLPRTADDYATVSVAVLLSVDSSGNCRDVRIALGSCGVTPIRARQAEGILEGRAPTSQRLRDAAETVAAEVDPSDDVRGSAGYKREMAPVMTRRALEQAWAQIAG
ncbi:MAG: xanthine dehydrogenase family protein subunit M [Chloroflexi bacterium]|nr:xanthine dehydrogenase family protein subunit M [Chloroflexota bacterium]